MVTRTQVAVMKEDPLLSAIELLPGRLYYNCYNSHPSRGHTATNGRPLRFFTIDDALIYWNFFRDFGPLNLGQLYRFCMKLNSKLGITPRSTTSIKSILSAIQNNSSTVCYYSSTDPERRANAILLICAWQVLFLDLTPEESFYPFRSHTSAYKQATPSDHSESDKLVPIPPFHDASPGVCTYELTVLDVLRGLAKARTYHFFQDFKTGSFNIDEYEHFELVENGDLNWIIDGQFLAFAGPQDRHEVSREGYVTLTPLMYIKYFEKKRVGLVVRLNKKCYDERIFTQNGINHVEHYYLDGSCPSKLILSEVISSFEKCIFESPYLRRAERAVAVHCKAGLGRTGTCIGAYMMKHYKFTAAEAIGWMRLCRPGCVIGPQQHFLQDIEQQMWYEGDVARLQVHRSLNANKKDATGAPVTKKPADAAEEEDISLMRDNARQKQLRSHRLKASASACRTSLVVSAFQWCEQNNTVEDTVTNEREGQGESLRAAHSKRVHQ